MTTDERRIAFRQASFALAEMLGQTPPVGIPLHSLEPGDEFWFPSARPGHRDYLMIVTCDYTVAHADLGCEAEMFSYNKPCRHMKESEIYVTNQRTQAPAAPPPTDLVVFNGNKVPMLIDFTDVQLANIRDTVCAYKTRDGMVKAPIAFVEQFVASCRATGLNPFLRQIYALPVGPTGWSVFAGIDGYRIAANRGGTFEGMDGPLWAIVTEDGEVPKDSDWVSIPAWQNAQKLKDTVANGGNLFCKVILYRRGSQRGSPGLVDFKAYGLDKVGKPGSRWDTDPCGMLAKCAEMQAYRRGWGLETAVLAQIPFEAEQSYELSSSPSVATAGLPEHLREEIKRREEPTQVPMAEDAPVQEGEWRDSHEPRPDEYAPPPAPSEPEPAVAEHPGAEVKPAILLTQFARAKRTQLLAANQAIESHFGYIVSQNGGRDLSRLTPEDEGALSDLLRDWLADRAQPHTANPAFNEDTVYVCGTCGVIMLEPKEEEPANA